jgi:hypothetical protein
MLEYTQQAQDGQPSASHFSSITKSPSMVVIDFTVEIENERRILRKDQLDNGIEQWPGPRARNVCLEKFTWYRVDGRIAFAMSIN